MSDSRSQARRARDPGGGGHHAGGGSAGGSGGVRTGPPVGGQVISGGGTAQQVLRRTAGATTYPVAATLQPASVSPASFSPSTMTPPLGAGGGGGGAAMGGTSSASPVAVFPSAPYAQYSDMSMAPSLRQVLLSPPRTAVTIAAARFAHLSNVMSIDPAPTRSALGQLLIESSAAAAGASGAAAAAAGATPPPVAPPMIQTYQCAHQYNGHQVILRRVVGTTATSEQCEEITNRLRHFRHPSLVPLHGIIHTNEFSLGSTDALVEHRSIRGAVSVAEAFFTPNRLECVTRGGGCVAEGTLWSMVVQLVGLIRMLHELGVPLRGLHISKLLWIEQTGRVMFSALGLMDVLSYLAPRPPAQSVEARLSEDVTALGTILIRLATGRMTGPVTLEQLCAIPAYSSAFTMFVKSCREGKKVSELCRYLGERFAVEVGQISGRADFLFNECGKEVHNGRLLNLLMKLNLVIAPEDATTAEMVALRLFHQYLFNQVDEQGHPRACDMAHVYFGLNKLDSASEELIQLVGADFTVLVTSFRDLKVAMESTLQRRMAAAAAPAAGGGAASSP